MKAKNTYYSSYNVVKNDCNSNGHIDPSSYFRYFERGRSDAIKADKLRKLQEKYECFLVVTKCTAHWHEFAKYGQVLKAETTLSVTSKYSIHASQKIYINDNPEAAASLDSKIACAACDDQGKMALVAMTPEMIECINNPDINNEAR